MKENKVNTLLPTIRLCEFVAQSVSALRCIFSLINTSSRENIFLSCKGGIQAHKHDYVVQYQFLTCVKIKQS